MTDTTIIDRLFTRAHTVRGRAVHGPSQALRTAGFSPVFRDDHHDDGIVIDWQRRRTSVRLVVVRGPQAPWTAIVRTPGGRSETITDLARLCGRVDD